MCYFLLKIHKNDVKGIIVCIFDRQKEIENNWRTGVQLFQPNMVAFQVTQNTTTTTIPQRDTQNITVNLMNPYL